MKWAIIDEGDVILAPVDDLVAHDTENGSACICGPSVTEPTPGRFVFAHYALDGRE